MKTSEERRLNKCTASARSQKLDQFQHTGEGFFPLSNPFHQQDLLG